MDFFRDVVQKNQDFLDKMKEFHNNLNKDCDSFLKDVDKFINTGNMDYFKNSISEKENAESVNMRTSKRGRATRRRSQNKLADITEINVSTDNTANIKREKISDIQEISKVSEVIVKDVNTIIKQEIEEMPAPRKLPPRRKKIKSEKSDVVTRSTRSRTRSKKQYLSEESIDSNMKDRNQKCSDIIIQNTTITTIEISDNEKETETESEVEKNACQEEIKTRNTRSKMRMQSAVENLEQTDGKYEMNIRTTTKQKKRARSNSLEEPTTEAENKKPRSSSDAESNDSVQTEYEDATSILEDNKDKEKNINVTYVTSKNLQDDESTIVAPINSTVIIENPQIITKPAQAELRVNITKSDQVEKSTPEPVKKTKGIKQVFSPFEKTPLKKKVEAFEKLGVNNTSIPTRVTRSKKRIHKKDSKEGGADEDRHKISDKPKPFTPVMSKFHPKVCSTSKISKLHPSNDTSLNSESILSIKSASALKASQAEFREREKRRQEKEREALKKREALLQAQTEEKRRKREEKQQKAQQQRELLEKEKQKQLEAQRIKEEKYNQALADREEKLHKQREEAEKKRLLVKKRAIELKEKEETVKMPELKKIAEDKVTTKQIELQNLAAKQKMEKQQQQRSIPVYMTSKPPLLPTDDCYDSDDPEYQHVRKSEPYWSKDKELREQQIAMIIVGEKIKNSFFCIQTHSPDLQEIFEHIDPRKLKRTSSAIWRKPPRYTLMPIIENQPLFSEESD